MAPCWAVTMAGLTIGIRSRVAMVATSPLILRILPCCSPPLRDHPFVGRPTVAGLSLTLTPDYVPVVRAVNRRRLALCFLLSLLLPWTLRTRKCFGPEAISFSAPRMAAIHGSSLVQDWTLGTI